MPPVPVRMMVWNIEQFSDVKITIPGMMAAIAEVVHSANVDVLIVLEVRKTNVATIGLAMSTALNAAGGGAGNNWLGYFLSEETGLEYYGVWIRDLNFIRPVVLDLPFGGPDGTGAEPLTNLYRNRWRVYPSPNFAVNAYPLAGALPKFPLTDLFSGPNRPLRKKRSNFGGQPIAAGGYALGRGYRLPCMPILVANNAGTLTWIPIVVCHYAAVRGGRNNLGQSQVNQLNQLHIPQLFNDSHVAYWLQYRNAAGATTFFPVQQLLYTGDFNLDFLQNAVVGTLVQRTNREAYDALTPTAQGGGSAAPAAAAGVLVPMPLAPYGPPWADPPARGLIDDQTLRAAVTTQGTIMKHPPLAVPPVVTAPPSPYSSAAFDNYLYGGAALNTAAPAFGPGGVDSGDSNNVPAFIIQTGAAGPGIDLSATAAHYALTLRRSAHTAPNLQAAAAAGPALTQNDRLVGARLVSDHLPVVMQFNVP